MVSDWEYLAHLEAPYAVSLKVDENGLKNVSGENLKVIFRLSAKLD